MCSIFILLPSFYVPLCFFILYNSSVASLVFATTFSPCFGKLCKYPVNFLPVFASHKSVIGKLCPAVPWPVEHGYPAVVKMHYMLKCCRRILYRKIKGHVVKFRQCHIISIILFRCFAPVFVYAEQGNSFQMMFIKPLP